MSVKGRCRFSIVTIDLIMDSGEVQNFVGIHPTQEALNGTPSSNSAEVKDSMVQEFSHFHPDIHSQSLSVCSTHFEPYKFS